MKVLSIWALMTAAAIWATAARVRADDPPTTTTTSPGADVRVTIDTSLAPELKDWSDAKVLPALQAWYPKIVAELPVDGCTPPDHFTIKFDPKYTGVAATSGTHVVANPKWFLANKDGEGVGALVHEEVHVVQQPGHKYRAKKMPSWLLEGTCDYIRWFQFEPEKSRPKPRGDKVKYDQSYRVTATFLKYVMDHYDKNILVEMNAANYDGTWTEDLWKQHTGKTADELGAEWKASLGN